MNKTISTLILLCCMLCSPAYAQYNRPENKVWAMGSKAGVDFTGMIPAAINTSINSAEGCAAVSNDTGGLLFYTNGSEIWNAGGSLMPHGQDITGAGIASTYSATQGALIVPDLKRCGIYYIFSLPLASGNPLYCSKVNMGLANGLGDVDTTFSLRRIPLKGGFSEKMIAIKSREKDKIWIILHHASLPEFYAYALSASGLDTVPVTSVAGNATMYIFGTMKANPLTDQIAVCNQVPGSSLALYDFDGTSGNVAFAKMIDSTCPSYGGTFSPDGSKFYTWSATNVVQYNLNLAYPAPAKIVVGHTKVTDMKLGPNGKIYFMSVAGLADGKSYLGSVESPDNPGNACQFRDSIPELLFTPMTPGIARLGLGLPNEVVGSPSYSPKNETVYDRKLCSFPAAGITFQAETGFSNYLWDNGATTTSRSVNQAGTYWLKYNTYCGPQTDTYKVAVTGLQPLSITYTNGLLSVANIYSYYQWYRNGQSIPGASQFSYTPTATGWYSVAVRKDAVCTDSAAYNVSELTGTSNLGKEYKISIFPNPAQDRIYIKATEPVNYSLYSIEGKVLVQGRGNTVDVTTLARGIYILKLTDKAGRYLATHKVRVK